LRELGFWIFGRFLSSLFVFLLLAFALAEDCGTEAGAKAFRQFVELGITVNLDCHLRGIANDVAVTAPGKVLLELCAGGGIDDAVEVVCQLL